jgi:hypothetical protein
MPSHQPKKYRDSQRHLPPANGGIADYRGVGLAGKGVNLLLATAIAASLKKIQKTPSEVGTVCSYTDARLQ